MAANPSPRRKGNKRRSRLLRDRSPRTAVVHQDRPPKLSLTLIEFAMPLLDVQERTHAATEQALTVAAAVWNHVIADYLPATRRRGLTAYVERHRALIDSLATSAGRSFADMDHIVTHLGLRKLDHYRDDLRLIANLVVEEPEPGHFRVTTDGEARL
jgi:hypothetical protein